MTNPTGLSRTTDKRLRRLCESCVNGAAAAAELELHEWQRQADCPPAARVLLASLLARRGELRNALHILRPKNGDHAEADPAVLQLLISILVAAGLAEAARRVIELLHHDHGDRPEVAQWLSTMDVPGATRRPAPSGRLIESLASDLLTRLHLLPSLVAAQCVEPDEMQIAVLRGAIERISHDVSDRSERLMICQAMAELALLSDDDDEARRWAHRGLKLNRYSAALALMLNRVADDEASGQPTSSVLAEAVAANPTYPDLRMALIRREHADGRSDAARAHLAHWLRREPNCRFAPGLSRELDNGVAA